MPATMKLSPVVLDILTRSTITDTSVILPPQQLDRKTYEAVDKALKAAGGKWNRSAKAHLFTRDPREALGLALETGEVTDQKKALQQFFTPPWLARDMAQQSDIKQYDLVLDPGAGTGVLAYAAALFTPHRCVTCYEIDPHLTPQLCTAGFRVIEQDFLTADPDAVYDHVLMNPPFSRHQDMAHILHAINFLKPHGTLQAIASAGVTFGRTKLHGQFQGTMAYYHADITPLPDDTFEESGTCVNTVRIALTMPA